MACNGVSVCRCVDVSVCRCNRVSVFLDDSTKPTAFVVKG